MDNPGVVTFIEEYPVKDGRYIADLAVFQDGILDTLVECVVTSPPSQEKNDYYEKELGIDLIIINEDNAYEYGYKPPPPSDPPEEMSKYVKKQPKLNPWVPKVGGEQGHTKTNTELEPEFEGDMDDGDDDDDAMMASVWNK
ncbi:hypothetical protein T492DRAFT_835074 [Pavlovales sp. CCMP2436]|nr:hypothetical protein T492DRAFT_835074 [Pavlovales sp. CCMP2436]